MLDPMSPLANPPEERVEPHHTVVDMILLGQSEDGLGKGFN